MLQQEASLPQRGGAVGKARLLCRGQRGSGNAVKSGRKRSEPGLWDNGCVQGMGSGRRESGVVCTRGPRGRGWRAAGSGGLRPGERPGGETGPGLPLPLLGAPVLVCGPGAGLLAGSAGWDPMRQVLRPVVNQAPQRSAFIRTERHARVLGLCFGAYRSSWPWPPVWEIGQEEGPVVKDILHQSSLSL